MIWTDSLAAAVGTGAIVVAVLWVAYACVPTILRRTVINRNIASPEARVIHAAAIQVFVLSWVWILHGALVVWLLIPHEWWVVWGLFVAMMAALGRTSYSLLGRLEDVRAVERRPGRHGHGEARPHL